MTPIGVHANDATPMGVLGFPTPISGKLRVVIKSPPSMRARCAWRSRGEITVAAGAAPGARRAGGCPASPSGSATRAQRGGLRAVLARRALARLVTRRHLRLVNVLLYITLLWKLTAWWCVKIWLRLKTSPNSKGILC